MACPDLQAKAAAVAAARQAREAARKASASHVQPMRFRPEDDWQMLRVWMELRVMQGMNTRGMKHQ